MTLPGRLGHFLNQRITKQELLILVSSIFLGLIFWFVDTLLDAWFFYKTSFLNLLIINVPLHEWYLRVTVMVLMLAWGMIVVRMHMRLRLAKQADLEYRKKSGQLFENFTEGFALHEIICDDSGEPTDYRFLAVNTAFGRLTGLQHGNVAGKTVRELFPGIERDSTGWIEKYGRVALTGEPLRLEDYSQTLGKWFSIQAFCPEHGQFAVTFSDITDRKKNETEARLMQDALLERQRHETEHVEQELSKVKDELIRKTQLAAIGQVSASIAHDLRNPLGCVRNASYLLKKRLHGDNPRYTKPLSIIDQEVEKADTIITNLLSIARCRPPQKENVNLDVLVQGIFERFEEDSHVQFEYQCENRPFLVYADLNQMDQILSNLVMNAFQAIEGRGRILIKAEHGPEVDVLVVQDSGPGIPDGLRSKIFEPLVTTKSQGTGLGLTICQQIVESHGGSIIVDNAPDRGTLIQIQLPKTMA